MTSPKPDRTVEEWALDIVYELSGKRPFCVDDSDEFVSTAIAKALLTTQQEAYREAARAVEEYGNHSVGCHLEPWDTPCFPPVKHGCPGCTCGFRATLDTFLRLAKP